MEKESTEAARARRLRSEAFEIEIQRAFRDRSAGIADRACAGIQLLGDKLTRDIEEQLVQVLNVPAESNRQFAERETARLLRMLEKRKALLDQLRLAIAIDSR